MKTNPVSKIVKAAFIALIACALGSSLTFAQATRTWVSGVGDDANPCSRTAPCKTFAGAISKTAAGGEISVLDPGGFGGVTVTKSITLDGEGTLASILVAGTPGITINAAGGVVSLKNLLIFGVGNTVTPGTIGVRIIAAAEVNIENCTIYEFSQKGVSIETSADCRVNIKNTIIRNCAQGAVLAAPTAGGVVANISKCSLNNSTFGFKGQGTVKAILDDCVAASNAANGVIASAGASVSVNNCTINDNGGG
ncbi:MAG: right-handed parallel beta-helix repeat-containing protein, partial [Chthoniobacteraceae bacterium]